MKNLLVIIKNINVEAVLLEKALRFSPESLCVVMVNPLGNDEESISRKISDYIEHTKPGFSNLNVKFFYEIDALISADYLLKLSSDSQVDLIILTKPEIVDGLNGLDLIKDLLRSSTQAKILMSRPTKWPSSVNVMCSIDVGSTDDHQIALDRQVFNYAKDELSDHLSINLHLASVISLSRVSQELELIEQSEVLLKVGPVYREKLNTFDQDHAVSDSKLLLAAGVPSKEICALAKQHKMELVVIGNVGRKGLTGMIIGNTAEKILTNISADVLVVNSNIQ